MRRTTDGLSRETHLRLDDYARDPRSLSTRERKRVERQLQRDSAMRHYVELLRHFYRDMETTSGPSGERLDALLNRIYSDEAVVHLRALPLETLDSDSGEPASTSSVSALSSPHGHIRGFVLLRAPDAPAQIRIVTDRPPSAAHALLSLPRSSMIAAVDEEGYAQLRVSEATVEALRKGEAASLRLPVELFLIDPQTLLWGPHEEELGGVRLSLRAGRDGLRLRVSGLDSLTHDLRYACVRDGRGVLGVAELVNRAGRVQALRHLSAGRLEVRLYR